jgi:hypothetical protein
MACVSKLQQRNIMVVFCHQSETRSARRAACDRPSDVKTVNRWSSFDHMPRCQNIPGRRDHKSGTLTIFYGTSIFPCCFDAYVYFCRTDLIYSFHLARLARYSEGRSYSEQYEQAFE